MAVHQMLKFNLYKSYIRYPIILNDRLRNPTILLGQYFVHTSPIKLFLYESDPKGEYAKFRQKLSAKEQIRTGLKQIKEEIEVWKTEVKEILDGEVILKGLPGVVNKAFEFKNEQDLTKWIVTSDKDNEEGFSTCQLITTESGTGLFTGNLCLDVPKDGKINKTGYCNMRTLRHKSSWQHFSSFDWGMYTHLVLRVRGDGRTYGINLGTAGYYDITWNDAFTFALFTRGGPYWQYTKVPFSKFFFTSKGRVQDRQGPIPLTNVSTLGFTMAERVPGPFQLEIDYIGVEYDPTHTEEFAYEMYKVEPGLCQV